MKSHTARHLICSDFHVPDHDRELIKKLLKFIDEYRPDHFHLLGDFMNFTKVSKYDQDPYYNETLANEIDAGNALLDKLVSTLKKANKKCTVTWYFGNHDDRLTHYLARNAQQLADLHLGDQYIISIPYLFKLQERGIKWHGYKQTVPIGNALLTHGDIVGGKGGMTAQKSIDKYGRSGFSGHVHRLAQVYRRRLDRCDFWIETGCMCNLQPTPAYLQNPDWQQAWVTCEVDSQGNVFPTIHPQ